MSELRYRTALLDHGYLGLVESWGSDETIIASARMSTGKGFLGWGPSTRCKKCGLEKLADGHWHPYLAPAQFDCEHEPETKPGDEKLLRYLWENKHSTPFEMAGATFEVQAPIMVFREWHRHRVPFGYSELSARYTPLPDVNYVPSVERLMIGSDGKNKQAGTIKDAEPLTDENAEKFQEMLKEEYKSQEEIYQWALKRGVPKELARIHLPVGRYSRMRATGNLRGWLGFLTLRMVPNAQYEIRRYAFALADILRTLFPRTMELFDGK